MSSDYIHIRKARLSACIGCTDEERSAPQPLDVSAKLYLDLNKPGITASLDDTVSWNDILSTLNNLAESKQWILVEEFAESAAKELLSAFSKVTAIEIEVQKFPFDGVESVGVMVHRVRSRDEGPSLTPRNE